jgi:hypothetical protein
MTQNWRVVSFPEMRWARLKKNRDRPEYLQHTGVT